jgi:hypothetical protein
MPIFLITFNINIILNGANNNDLDIDKPITTLQGTYIVNTTADFVSLSNNISFNEHVKINATENIIGTLQNFSLAGGRDFTIEATNDTIDIDFIDCNFTRTLEIKGDPIIKFDNIKITGNTIIYSGGADITINNSIFEGIFQTYRYEYSIDNIIDSLDMNVENSLFDATFNLRIESTSVSKIELYNSNITVSGTIIGASEISLVGGNLGDNIQIANTLTVADDLNLIAIDKILLNSLSTTNIEIKGYEPNQNITIYNNSNIQGELDARAYYSSVVLNLWNSQLTNVTLREDLTTNIDGSSITNLFVHSTSTTWIEGSVITNLFDYVNPSLDVSENSIQNNYDLVLNPELPITLSWTGSDNIIGTNYNLSYRVLIYKDGSLITNTTINETSYTFNAQTTSSYSAKVFSIDADDNLSSEALISITFIPELGTFLLILFLVIGIVAGATAAIVIFLYLRAKSRWKKTPIMSMPSGEGD